MDILSVNPGIFSTWLICLEVPDFQLMLGYSDILCSHALQQNRFVLLHFDALFKRKNFSLKLWAQLSEILEILLWMGCNLHQPRNSTCPGESSHVFSYTLSCVAAACSSCFLWLQLHSWIWGLCIFLEPGYSHLVMNSRQQ